MKATDLLKKQHARVDELLDLIEDVDSADDREALLDEVATEIAAHMLVEEDQFYPAVRARLGAEAGVEEAVEEHTMTALALKLLLHAGPRERSFDAKLCVLRELLDQHIDEEHEELFPAVDELFDRAMLHDLGAEMEDSFQALKQQGHQTLLQRYPGVTASHTAEAHPL